MAQFFFTQWQQVKTVWSVEADSLEAAIRDVKQGDWKCVHGEPYSEEVLETEDELWEDAQDNELTDQVTAIEEKIWDEEEQEART